MHLNPSPDGAGAAHDRLYRSLRTRVMHGELDPGTRLTLRGIAAEYTVSMTPVREAMRRLVAEGAQSLSTSDRVTTPKLAPERIEEFAALRSLLQPELAARALPRAHAALIERMEAIEFAIAERNAKRTPRATSTRTSSSTARSTAARRPRRCWPWPKRRGCNWGRRCGPFTGG